MTPFMENTNTLQGKMKKDSAARKGRERQFVGSIILFLIGLAIIITNRSM